MTKPVNRTWGRRHDRQHAQLHGSPNAHMHRRHAAAGADPGCSLPPENAGQREARMSANHKRSNCLNNFPGRRSSCAHRHPRSRSHVRNAARTQELGTHYSNGLPRRRHSTHKLVGRQIYGQTSPLNPSMAGYGGCGAVIYKHGTVDGLRASMSLRKLAATVDRF